MKNRIQKLIDEQNLDRIEIRNFVKEQTGINISRQCMHGYCVNDWQPSAPIKRSIAEYFNLSVNKIFYNEREKAAA